MVNQGAGTMLPNKSGKYVLDDLHDHFLEIIKWPTHRIIL
jgi:hypothetical protein